MVIWLKLAKKLLNMAEKPPETSRTIPKRIKNDQDTPPMFGVPEIVKRHSAKIEEPIRLRTGDIAFGPAIGESIEEAVKEFAEKNNDETGGFKVEGTPTRVVVLADDPKAAERQTRIGLRIIKNDEDKRK